MPIPLYGDTLSPAQAGGGYADNALGAAVSRLGSTIFDSGTGVINRETAREFQVARLDAHIARVRTTAEAQKLEAKASVDLATQAQTLGNTSAPDKADDAYSALITSTRAKYLDQIADPGVKQAFTDRFDVWAENHRLNVRQMVRTRQLATAKATLGETLDGWQTAALLAKTPEERAAAMASGESAIDALYSQGLMTAEGEQAIRASFRGKADIAFARQAIDADPTSGKAKLQAGEWPSLGADQRQALIEGADREREHREVQARVAAKQAQIDERAAADQAYADLYTLVDRGAAGQKEVDAFDEKFGAVAPLKVKALNALVTNALEKQEKDAARLGLVQSALAGEQTARAIPQKDVDLYYERVAAPLMDPDKGGSLAPLTDLISRTGKIPTQVREGYDTQMKYGTPETRAHVAVQAQWLADYAPGAFGELTEDTRRSALLFNAYLQAGANPKEAAERVDHQLAPTDAIRASRAAYLKGQSADGTRAKSGQAPIDLAWGAAIPTLREGTGIGGSNWFTTAAGLTGNEPGVDQARADFERFFAPAYEATGDEKVAAQEAVGFMRRTWGVTSIGGGTRWMKYAPETIYQRPAGELVRDLEAQAKALPGLSGVNAERLLVSYDTRTAKDVGERLGASYPVLLVGEDGVLTPLVGQDGMAWRWRPGSAESAPVSFSEAQKASLAAASKKQVQARAAAAGQTTGGAAAEAGTAMLGQAFEPGGAFSQ